jgi:hypothetical protein
MIHSIGRPRVVDFAQQLIKQAVAPLVIIANNKNRWRSRSPMLAQIYLNPALSLNVMTTISE